MELTRIFIRMLILLVWLYGCVISYPPPIPSNLLIASPSADVPVDIAAFSGIWEGRWGGMKNTESIITIEKINNQSAEIIFSFGGVEPGYISFTGVIIPGPKIKWETDKLPSIEGDDLECPCIMTFEINKELDIMIGYMEFKEYNFKVRGDFKRRKL